MSGDTSVFIMWHTNPGSSFLTRIDTAFNIYNESFRPGYPRYKLDADSGDSWNAGEGFNPGDSMIVTVVDVYEERVFGVMTTIKVFRFVNVPPPPDPPFWLGDEYLASGFGLVRSVQEPTLILYLAGAIIDSVQWGQVVSVKKVQSIPARIELFQNYPNPFNPSTTIPFDVSQRSYITVKVYDVLGRDIMTLVDEEKEPGSYSAEFNARSLSGGVYFYRLESEGIRTTRKMILTK